MIPDTRFGRTLAQLRADAGLTYRALAKLAHLSHTYLWEIETGRKPPTVELAGHLDRALGAGGRLTGLVTATANAAQLTPDDVDRLARVTEQPRTVDAASVDALTVVLSGQRRLEDAVGADALLAPVRAQLDVVERLVIDARGEVRGPVVSVGAQWAQFAGWLNEATSDHQEAARRYVQALEWATEAGDPNMVATALNMRGHLAWMARQVGPMVGLSQAAARHAVTPGIKALAVQQHARAEALCGDAHAVDRLLDQAAALTVRAAEHPEDEPPWVYFFDPDYLDLQRAIAYQYLGRAEKAIDLLTAALDRLPAPVRRSEWVGRYVLRLAAAHARAGDRATAAEVAEEVLALAETAGSPQLAREASKLLAGLG